MVKLGVTMFYTSNWTQPMLPVHLNKQRYCRLHGYTYHCENPNLDRFPRPPAWYKVKLLQRLLPRFEWLMWTDADAVFINPHLKLTDLLDDEHDIILSGEEVENGGVNTGNMILRNCPWTAEFLQRVWDQDDAIYHPWWEQVPFIRAWKSEEDGPHFKVLPQEVLNNWYEPTPETIVQHFAGVRDVGKVHDKVVEVLSTVVWPPGSELPEPRPGIQKRPAPRGLRFNWAES
jgi:hypothetical protein